jgi:uncharacterized protein
MRIPHCTVALAVAALFSAAAGAQAPVPAQPVIFNVFYQGTAVGREQVTVTRTPQGISITGTEQVGDPLNIVVRSAEVKYSPDWRPLECVIEGSLRTDQVLLHTIVSGTTASNAVTQGKTNVQKSDQIAADALLLPNMFFGAYEALAARLYTAKAGDELAAYVPPNAAVKIAVTSVTEDRIRTQQALIPVRRYAVSVTGSNRPSEAEVWVDPDGRLLRLSVLTQGLDVVRSDIASITARREQMARPNDELVQVPSYGFSLAGTLSKPASRPSPAFRFPAVVLISGSGPADRDETLAGVPIFGELANALADAGYVVVRYDKRGVGQSGGRPESTTLGDFADDAIAAAKFLQRRKDVDPKRIALLGYGEGGAIAATAASREGDVAALVLLDAPGVSGYDLALEQQRHLLALMKLTDAERQQKIEMQEKLQKAVIAGRGFEGIPSDLRRQAETPWFQSFLTYDPVKVMKKIHQPILIVHGELDRQIAPSNADKLEALAKARKGRAGQEVKLVKIPGMNHLLLSATTGEPDEYDKLTDRKISGGAVSAIVSWLGTTMRAR